MKKKSESKTIETLANLFNVSLRVAKKFTTETQFSMIFGEYYDVDCPKPDKVKVIIPLLGEVEAKKNAIGQYNLNGKYFRLTEIAEYYEFVPLNNIE